MNTNDFINSISFDTEIWKNVIGFEEYYKISSFGRIISCLRTNKNGTINKPHLCNVLNSDDYPTIFFNIDGKSKKRRLAKLVADHFLGECPKNYVLDFKDGDKTNCTLDNLFYRESKIFKKKTYPKVENLPNEIWKDIKNLEGYYQVSSLGRIKRLSGRSEEHIVVAHVLSNGYWQIGFHVKGKAISKLVHRLVAETFIDNPENKPNVDHIDTDKSNNTIYNLRWVTQEENQNNPLTKQHISESIIKWHNS